MTMKSQKTPILPALWVYLSQPLLNTKCGLILNPLKFTIPYRIRLLERCFAKDYELEQNRQHLELCWGKSFVLRQVHELVRAE
ncbi:hypothetical protein IQ260_11305 [Leptolyngbya cf. ectocarpi LEGE 11479]|uniref:Uncharacterized protein n=1 Tax=Leptolyngbya cf. ectocarpi LEGE 11479 TaxID=1828722 RepID=A0A928ZRY5_LEPEC|nr:hypothetical protein [Leptolyngbya ectocarpi]MBE9067243.1 hypothetical protein [Leptolyngbya cf. ectocarpi LEGE 11479]